MDQSRLKRRRLLADLLFATGGLSLAALMSMDRPVPPASPSPSSPTQAPPSPLYSDSCYSATSAPGTPTPNATCYPQYHSYASLILP